MSGSTQLSQWPALLKRLEELKNQGLSATQIAGQFHNDGFRPASGALTPEIVRTCL